MRLIVTLTCLALWTTMPARADDRAAAIERYIELCGVEEDDHWRVDWEWKWLHDDGYTAGRIYRLSSNFSLCEADSFRSAILIADGRDPAKVGALPPPPANPSATTYAASGTGHHAQLRQLSKGDLYAARIGYGVGGGVCLGVGFALLGAVGITAAMNDTFDREFGSYSNSWSPYTIAGMIISGTAGLIMIPIGAGLLGKATAASREFDRREYGARVSVAPWPGGLTIAVRW